MHSAVIFPCEYMKYMYMKLCEYEIMLNALQCVCKSIQIDCSSDFRKNKFSIID